MENILFVLSKIVTPFFSPLFLILLVLIIFLLRLRRNAENRRVRFWLLAFCFASFIVSMPVIPNALIRLWQVPPDTSLGDEKASSARWDSLVLLGGGLDPARSNGWQISVNDAADRLESAARLWHQGLVRSIIVTGGSGDIHNQELLEAPLMRRLLAGLGVEPGAVLVEDQSRNTYENAANSLKLIRQAGGARLILVTSALHMRRAEAIFRKALAKGGPDTAGMTMDVLAVDSQAEPTVFPESFIPDGRALFRLAQVGREMVGYVSYWVLGRL